MKLKRCDIGHIYDELIHPYCPYCKENKVEEKKKEYITDTEETIVYVEENIKKIVGWLVCIFGPEKGKDYKIHSERNFIGKGDNNDICLRLEKNIEYYNHCSITYNPKQRIFVITPGASSQIVYVKNRAIYETTEIQNYDILEIGSSKFVFLAFCGLNFDWEVENEF